MRRDQAAFKGGVLPTSTPADLKKLYSNLGPALDQARSKAPGAIRGDIDTFITAFRPVLKALSDANYDFTKLSPTSFAAIGTPQVRAASEHIRQYETQVCHITTTTG